MTPSGKGRKRKIESYSHGDAERANNPPVGLVTPETDQDRGKKRYAFDPHIDPQLQWAGKAEHASFDVPTVSLHVHERIDPRAVIEAVRARNGNGQSQSPLFELPEENPPLRQAVEFYQHSNNWKNRMIAGDSLLVMNSLIEKENMAGKVQTIYIDPPYGIKYGSNFQPFVNQKPSSDGRDKDSDLTTEPEQIRAFRDTWELGIHSYLTYLRDRLLLSKQMLTDSGSVFVQIGDENVHLARMIMDEVFGTENHCAQIAFQKSGKSATTSIPGVFDYLLWYAKDRERLKVRNLLRHKRDIPRLIEDYKFDDGDGMKYRLSPINSQGYSSGRTVNITYRGDRYHPGTNRHWSIDPNKIPTLLDLGILTIRGNSIFRKLYLDQSPGVALNNLWDDTARGSFGGTNMYVVQTTIKPVQRCILMTTDPGDLVLDPTCGSGTTAYVAEQWGRRWMTCDTSRVALVLARQRLMTAVYDYYELAHPDEGVGSGFRYKTVPHVTLRSIANNPDIEPGMTRAEIDAAIARHSTQQTLYDQPHVDSDKIRVSGPFTVEAVPAPAVKGLEDIGGLAVSEESDDAAGELADIAPRGDEAANEGETLRQGEWLDELLRTGIRGKSGQYIRFARLEPLPGSPGLRAVHADGETLPNGDGSASVREGAAEASQRVVVSFGPEHAPMEQRQVGRAFEEAQFLVPKPRIIVFVAFQFDPEAAKDIDETQWAGVTILKAQMNPDMLTDDLKKRRASNESFWLIGQPDVGLRAIREGDDAGKWLVDVRGFDYYNTKTGDLESGGEDRIAVWMLDTDYDGRSLYPRQVFFPMAGSRTGWGPLSDSLRAEVDADLIEAYRGTTSLPFDAGEHRRIAVKIVDDRGIESLRVLGLGG